MANEEKSSQFVKRLLDWHQRNRRTLPWRTFRSPYTVFVSEYFLQRTPAERVAAFFCEFVRDYPNPCILCSADPDVVLSLSTRLGLKKRIWWLTQASKIICERFGGRIPDTDSSLRSLPGVGPYTSSAILSFAFNRDIAIVDVNVVRVLTRFFGLKNSKRMGNREIESLANELLPTGRSLDFNEATLDFAALVCRKKPEHERCPLVDYCACYSNLSSAG